MMPESLGSSRFRERYGLRYAYCAGAMYKGIASVDLVVRMARAKLLSFFGTGGLTLPRIEAAVEKIQHQLLMDQPYGMNLLCNLDNPSVEMLQADLFIRKGVPNVEAAAFMLITPALVRYRLSGLRLRPNGTIEIPHRIIAKVSRPEVAVLFMEPAPPGIVNSLVANGLLTEAEAKLGELIPVAHDICVEADSGGHTDQRVAHVLVPTIRRIAQEKSKCHGYSEPFQIGAAGGIGTPEAIVASFVLGADFIVTGSINQCTVEAGTSPEVKNILAQAEIQDTAYAPAGDMFEIGAKVQVLRRGLFFAARANKLFELYQRYPSIDAIDEKTQRQLQDVYFRKTFAEIWEETKSYYLQNLPRIISEAEKNPKKKMALIFKWYFIHSTRLALRGAEEQRVDYQIQCGPALGAFNQWVKNTPMAKWENRHVDDIADKLMSAAADCIVNFSRGFENALSPTQ